VRAGIIAAEALAAAALGRWDEDAMEAAGASLTIGTTMAMVSDETGLTGRDGGEWSGDRRTLLEMIVMRLSTQLRQRVGRICPVKALKRERKKRIQVQVDVQMNYAGTSEISYFTRRGKLGRHKA
jgi:hypothetical protein